MTVGWRGLGGGQQSCWRGEGALASWRWQKGFNLCSLDSVQLLSEKASRGCPEWLLCYLWTAKLQVQAAALIQQNTANPLQCYELVYFFFPQGLAFSYAFYAFFFPGMLCISRITLLTAVVSV